MKIVITIADDLFERAECLARQTKKSRNRLFSDAIREYVARHGQEDVTDAMNRACAQLDHAGNSLASENSFISTASARILERTEW